MKKRAQTDGSLALQDKQYRVITIEPTKAHQDAKLRVAAYARVSSASEDQLNSFAAQNRYYTTLISNKENWSMVDIYADEGITGTSAEKRGDFQRLLADCRRGLVDRILVKSISRFARNTKECLEILRELKLLGVSVFFEKETIDTAHMSGEMMTTLFASFAQAESESISGNMRWSYQKRMQDGTFNTYNAPLGFDLVEGKLEIHQDEADVIRGIYVAYLNGKNSREIAASLNEHGVLQREWHREIVDYILKNERYAGNALLQKRYTTDTFPTAKKRNRGERQMYFVEGSNIPIIPQEMYDQAQMLRKRRLPQQAVKAQAEKPLSGKVYCGSCGAIYRYKSVNQTNYWVCTKHDESKNLCSVKPVAEKEIYAAFLRLYYNLKHQGSAILEEMITHIQTIRSHRMLWSEDVIELNKKISDLSSQNQMLTQLKQQGLIDPDIFIYQSNELAQQLREAKRQKGRLLDQNGDGTLTQTQNLLEVLEVGPDILESFDAVIFDELVDKIIVDSNTHIQFRLKNGLELAETIERTVR